MENTNRKHTKVSLVLLGIVILCAIMLGVILGRRNPKSKKDKILAYMKDHNFTIVHNEAEYSLETIKLNEQKYTIVKAYLNDEFYVQLYYVEYDEKNNIKKITPCGGGIEELFDYNTITMSEGDFMYVYSSTNMGNGSLDLYDLANGGVRKYSIQGCIDRQYDDSEEVAKLYGVSSGDDGKKASVVFKDDKLMVEFDDYDGDGNTDIKLSGSKLLYGGNVDESKADDYWYGELIEVIPCEYIYYYDTVQDDFVLGYVNETRNQN